MPQTYTRTQRLLHWLTAVFIAALVVLGLWMKERSGANIWDALTNTLYAWHKLIGFLVLLLTALRVIVKLRSTRPPYPPSVPPSTIKLAAAVHGVLYLLLLAVPLLGWAGVTAYPALITVGGYNLPAMPGIPQDQALAKQLVRNSSAIWHSYVAAACARTSHSGALPLSDQKGWRLSAYVVSARKS